MLASIALAALAGLAGLAAPPSWASEGSGPGRVLRVCADPDNLPYSHVDGSGFENRIARLVADELGATLVYTWTPLRRGFVRKTMGEGACDLFVGVPADFERVLATRAYYRSTWVIVQRAHAHAPLAGLDDPRLRDARLGVQVPGGDFSATAAGHALVARGAVANVAGFPVYGDLPAAQRMIDTVVAGELDAVLVWGPQAGWFASRAGVPLAVTPIPPRERVGPLPFEHSIAMGVRRGDRALKRELDALIERRAGDLDAILAEYAVPRIDLPTGGTRP
jgi:mxaJ protein